MNYVSEFKNYSMKEKCNDIISKEYFKFRKDTLRNAIFRTFTYNPDKDLQKFGKRRKNLGTLYEFEDLDLDKEMSFKDLVNELDSGRFIHKAMRPKSKSEFRLITFAMNKEIDTHINSLKQTFHRNYGLRIYQVPIYWQDGRPVKKFCLVPTNTRFFNLVKNHPCFSKEVVSKLKYRTTMVESLVGKLEKKLETYRKELQDVLRKFRKLEREQGWKNND